jgi:chromosome segregation ATPase
LEGAINKDVALHQKTIQLQGITAIFKKERVELQDMVQKGVERMYQDSANIEALEAQAKDLNQKIEAIKEAKARIEFELDQEQEYTQALEEKVKEMTLRQEEMLKELEKCRCNIM